MAIAATWVVNGAPVTNSASQVYTVPTTYNRDLVVTNAGATNIYVGLSNSGTVVTAAAGVEIPAGGSLLLTQCQAPTSAVLSAITASGTSLVSVGYASVVSVI